MRYNLFDYQFGAARDIVRTLRRAGDAFQEDRSDYWSVSLSAPTGAGKTVIAAAVIETLFDGGSGFSEDPLATVLWVTDDPALNEQTKRNMIQASSTLTKGRLITIDSGFDEELFETRRVYFLNIQKLARSNPLSSSAGDRTYSLWQTIANTIRLNGAHFYVIIDEAHRGMKPERDRATIVSRIINGQEGINPPFPIVWGISATPERFLDALERWSIQRTNRPVNVPLEDVRASGLLKDKIILDNPVAGQTEGDTTLTREAVAQTLRFEAAWAHYASEQGEPPVLPALVVQVPNAPSAGEMTDLLNAIFAAWPSLSDRNVVNTFGEHVALSVGGHTIDYLTPQDIQDDLDVRVVLCKDAISTGWDCPRAEVLVSMRRAQDYTYIAQLIGRMVRTPLARRVTTDQSLNDVHCYLPRFNKHQVKIIVDRFTAGKSDEPPVEIVTEYVRVWRNEALPPELVDLLQSLPTYVVPGRIYRTQLSRLHTLATLLSGDRIVEDAIAYARIQLNSVLEGQRAVLEASGQFQQDLTRLRHLKIERSYALLGAETMDDLPVDMSYEAIRDDNNIEDLYRVAIRKLPEGVAQNFWNSIISKQTDEDFDPIEAKAVTAVLALHPEVIEAVESAAEQIVRTWLRRHQRAISALPDAKKAAYEPVKRQARDSELSDLILPETKTVRESERWRKHILAAEDGTYPEDLKGWESQVVKHEVDDVYLVGWYRNPRGTSAALRIPYQGEARDRPMYPDFIFFHRTDEGIRPSIVDPHGYHLADAVAKLRGLATYAERHGDVFARIESVIEDPDGTLLAVDWKSESARVAIKGLSSSDVDVVQFFNQHGGRYS